MVILYLRNFQKGKKNKKLFKQEHNLKLLLSIFQQTKRYV